MNDIGHRDIKTENLLIDKNFNLKIADFGCSCKTKISTKRKNFDTQVVVGSPEFNAPEITNAEEGDRYFAEEDDIFCLASVLFLMVMKSSAFNCSNIQDPYYQRLLRCPTQFWEIFYGINNPSEEFKGIFPLKHLFNFEIDLIQAMTRFKPEERITL